MVLSSSSRNSLSQKIMNCCSICDKQYTHSSSLTHSSKVHTNCNQLSGKSFSKKGRLKIPLTVHSSNKPALSDTADQTVAEYLKKESKTHFLQDRVVNVYPSDKENENSYRKRKRCTSVRLVHPCACVEKHFPAIGNSNATNARMKEARIISVLVIGSFNGRYVGMIEARVMFVTFVINISQESRTSKAIFQGT